MQLIDAFTAYKAATGAALDPSTDLLKIASEQFKNLESLFFHIGDVSPHPVSLHESAHSPEIYGRKPTSSPPTHKFGLGRYVSVWMRGCLGLTAIIFQLNTAIGGDDDSVYLVVGDLGSNTGEGLDFVDGFTFLQRFYSVYDATNNKFGLATTPFTNATTN